MKLNFACGETRWPGFDNSDIHGEPGTNYVDLEEFPYPYEDDSANLILLSHALQMTSDGTTPVHPDPFSILSEFHRILKPDGWLRIDENPWRIHGPGDEQDALGAKAAFPDGLRISRGVFLADMYHVGFRGAVVVPTATTLIPADEETLQAILGNHQGHRSFTVEAQK